MLSSADSSTTIERAGCQEKNTKAQSPPLVSVIMPSYNSEKYIAESIESVLNQRYSNIELLITDDCSTDGTKDVVASYAENDFRVKFYQLNENSGAACARNNSLKNSVGRYVAFLDSDDVWHLDKLNSQISFMLKNEYCMTFTAYEVVQESGMSFIPPRLVDTDSKAIVNYSDMLKKRATMGCSTVVVDRELFGDFLMPNIRTGQDYALWLSLLKTGVKAHCIREVYTFYRLVPGSISSNKFRKARRQFEIYRKLENLSLPSSLMYFFYYAKNAIFRK